MNRSRGAIILLSAVILCLAVVACAQPQTVPWMADFPLDQATYAELAREWREYIDTHGESAQALTNLSRAYEYSGEREAALIAARRAAEIEPDAPEALYCYGKLLFKYDRDRAEALRLLERSRQLAPDAERTLTMLAIAYMQRGDFKQSEELFRTIHTRNILPRPLQDFAYNMLVGLPEGALVITNGDNDTFPPLALQAGMAFRTDVIVLNRNLLNLDGYREAFFERHPRLAPRKNMGDSKTGPVAPAIIKELIKARRVPVYIASTVKLDEIGPIDASCIEGINFCVTGPHLTEEQSARLLLDTYRLDSATDWSFAWDLKPALAGLMSNYVSSMYLLAEKGGIAPESRRLLIEKALHIAEFHDFDHLAAALAALQKK